jgi:hypothetical protein
VECGIGTQHYLFRYVARASRRAASTILSTFGLQNFRQTTSAWLPTALQGSPLASCAFPYTLENWQNCSGRRGSGKGSRRNATGSQSTAAGGSIARSRCSDPGGNSAGSGRIARLHWPRPRSANGSCICGSGAGKPRRRRELLPKCWFYGRRERRACRTLDRKVALIRKRLRPYDSINRSCRIISLFQTRVRGPRHRRRCRPKKRAVAAGELGGLG